VFSALAFIHLCLHELQEVRSGGRVIEAEVTRGERRGARGE
jgi:hypothetical protein